MALTVVKSGAGLVRSRYKRHRYKFRKALHVIHRTATGKRMIGDYISTRTMAQTDSLGLSQKYWRMV
jgi:hypothetical protein